MALLTPPPAAPQRGDRTTFANRVDAFITWLINFVSEMLALVANLNTIAFGGAYSITYTVNTGTAGGGVVAMYSSSDQRGSTTWYFGETDISGKSLTNILNSFTASSSTVKGTIRIVKQNDPSQWISFSLLSLVPNGTFRTATVQPIDGSAAAVFGTGDAVVLSFQRTGDKGDAGSLTPVLWVRDEKASGTAGGSAAASGFVTRALNTIKKNTIPGASVAGNQATLPAGTYRVDAIAPATNVGQHQAYLYNVTDGVTQVVGTSSYAGGSTITTHSMIGRAEFTLTATKVFEIRHWTNTGTASTGLGAATGSSQGEVYTQAFIEKVS